MIIQHILRRYAKSVCRARTFCGITPNGSALGLRASENISASNGLHCTTTCFTSKWCVGKPNGNPLDELNQYVNKPVISEKDLVFQPTASEIQQRQILFRLSEQKIKSLKGVVNLKDLPPAKLPEVCFVGRSNVGKSSLIKSLFFDPSDIKISISSKPGHTRTLKFYNIPRILSLVDMPGYGYNMPDYFVESVEEYMKNRTTLQRIFLLIDGSVGVTPTDEIGLNMLEEFGKSYTVVFTKIDKTSHHRVLNNLFQFNEMRKENLMCCLPQPFLVSAHLAAGLPLLRAFIAYVTGNIKIVG